jgi:hypothetical protein
VQDRGMAVTARAVGTSVVVHNTIANGLGSDHGMVSRGYFSGRMWASLRTACPIYRMHPVPQRILCPFSPHLVHVAPRACTHSDT